MTDDDPEIFNMLYIENELTRAKNRGDTVKSMRVGADLKAAFIRAAGEHLVNGEYRGIPVTFNAINPEGVSFDTESS